jgi:hypothetical protein
MDAMMDAREEVIGCITGTPPSEDDVRKTRRIAKAIEDLSRKGVKVQYLLPKFPDRLQIAVLYTKAGAEVRFSTCLMVHNLRYIVVDDRIVVLGVPENIGEREATKKGFKVPSEGLARVLKDYFVVCDKQCSLSEYIQEVIGQTGATLEQLAREFHLDEKDLKRARG